MTTLQVIFDAAGGITVQTTTFAAHYTNPSYAAHDALLIAEGVSTSGWESYDDDRIKIDDSFQAAVRNGGYRLVDAQDILSAKTSGAYDTSWINERDFFRALGGATI